MADRERENGNRCWQRGFDVPGLGNLGDRGEEGFAFFVVVSHLVFLSSFYFDFLYLRLGRGRLPGIPCFSSYSSFRLGYPIQDSSLVLEMHGVRFVYYALFCVKDKNIVRLFVRTLW